MQFRIPILGLLLAISQPVIAAEFPHAAVTEDSRDGDHIELGLSFGLGVFPLIGFNEADSIEESDDIRSSVDVIIEGRLQHRGFFLELARASFDTYALGYSVFESDEASFEILAAKLFHEVNRDHIEGLRLIDDRESDVNLGFRNGYFFGDTILQTELVGNLSNSHLGFVATVQVGHQKQFGNWRAHGLLGLRYFSDNVLDHYFGVDIEEGGDFGPTFNGTYQASAGIMASGHLQLSYPLSEKFVFNSSFEYDRFPAAIFNSPLAQGTSRIFTSVGITYIIGGG